jgi:hypothetical protein
MAVASLQTMDFDRVPLQVEVFELQKARLRSPERVVVDQVEEQPIAELRLRDRTKEPPNLVERKVLDLLLPVRGLRRGIRVFPSHEGSILHVFVHSQEVRSEGGVRVAHTLRHQRGFVQRCSALVAVIALAIAGSASAATVVAFVAAGSGDMVIVSNPHGSTVTGQIRIVLDAAAGTILPVPFSLPGQGSQAFPNVLSAVGATPAILAVETSDTVQISTMPLRLAFPDRPLTLPIRFAPSAPGTGSLVLGILNGVIRISIYEHPTSVTPLVSRIFSSVGEQVTRLRYADLLPVGMSISDGIVVVTPLTGQAVAVSVNAPVRRRAVGRASSPPPILSIAGDACEFATGMRASVPASAGATYRWSLLNATAQGTVTGNALDIALGSRGYASLILDAAGTPGATTAEATFRIEGKPLFESSNATSVTLGEDATIDWTLVGSPPTAQTLSSTDFATVTLEASATSYKYRPTTVGTKIYALNASNTCGASGGSSGTYVVSAACTTPNASVSVPAFVQPNTTFTASMPVGADTYQWQVSGNGSIVSGATSAIATIQAGTSGSISITGTATNGTCTATDTKVVSVSPAPPVISNVSVMPNPVLFGGLAAIDFTTLNTTSWAISSAIGNGFTSDPPHAGSGDGDHFVIYSASSNDGQETMTITASGPGGQTTQTLSFLVSDNAPNTPPTVSPVVATNTPSGLTLAYTLSGANYWVLDPPLCSPGSGRGSGTFSAQCSATRFSEQYYSVYGIGGSGFAGGAVLTVYVSAPSSAAANATFTASMGASHSAYSWSVSNGTILSGQGTQTVTIRAGTAGTPLTIQGTASSGSCCTAIDTVTVTVNP